MDYVLVCPSHRRVKTFENKTYSLLKRTNAPKPILWVKDKKDIDDYSIAFPELEICSGGTNIAETRNSIQKHFPIDTKIVMIDDDIKNVVIYDSQEHNKKRNLENFSELVKLGFSLCEKYGTSLFGVYAVDNPYFMRPVIRTNLSYINGSLFGVINKHIDVDLSYAEDYERAIKHFLLEKKVLRLDFVGLSTRYYKEKGGLQETRTEELNKSNKEELVKRYPELIKTIVKRDRTEIGFIKSRGGTIPFDDTYDL